MKIDINDSYTQPSHNTITGQKPPAAHSESAAENESASPGRTDSVTISSAARLVDGSSMAGDADPVFDTQRVARLKATIRTGNYVINHEQTAVKLHEFTLKVQ